MKWLLSTLLLLLSLPALAKTPTFKVGIYSLPRGLYPQHQKSSSSYLFHSLFRNLFLYNGQNELVLDLAEKCQRKKKGHQLHCYLKKGLKWNQGDPLTSEDFLKTYQAILKPDSKAQRPDFLFPVLNAQEIFEGKKPMSSLGIKTPSPHELVFEFVKPDDEFEYNLSSFYLSPTKGSYQIKNKAKYYTNGPYQIKDISEGHRILLESNPHYPHHTGRPPVEFLMVEDDSVSLRLYDKNELHWVRRVPTILLSKYKSRKDFHEVPALRFDYIAFMGSLKNNLSLRTQLAESLDYLQWQKLLFSVGRPGCSGLPESWFSTTPDCYELKKHKPLKNLSLQFAYSLQGGDDHRRTAEWLQAQWKKNLGITLQVRGLENKNFVATIKNNPPSLFRKGLAPDRPTCSAIMENFTSDHPENYLQNKDPEFDLWVDQLRQSSDRANKKSLCLKLLKKLMDSYQLIPTGHYNYSFLVSPEFTGWTLNQINNIDLTHLRRLKN